MKKLFALLVVLCSHGLLAMEKEPKEQERPRCLAAIELSFKCNGENGGMIAEAVQQLAVSLPRQDGSLHKIFNCYFVGCISNGYWREGNNNSTWDTSITQTKEYDDLSSDAKDTMMKLLRPFRDQGSLLFEFFGDNAKNNLFVIDKKGKRWPQSEVCAEQENATRSFYEKMRATPGYVKMYNSLPCSDGTYGDFDKDERESIENTGRVLSSTSDGLTSLAKKFLALCASEPQDKKE